MVSQKYYNLMDGFVTFLIPSLLHALLTVSLQKGTPSQLLIYSMEVSIYIYIYWIFHLNNEGAHNMGNLGKRPSRIQGLGQGEGARDGVFKCCPCPLP